MKTLLLVAAGAIGAIMLLACATHETTATPATTTNPSERTYSKSQVNKTGQPDTAGAIQAADPGAQIH